MVKLKEKDRAVKGLVVCNSWDVNAMKPAPLQ